MFKMLNRFRYANLMLIVALGSMQSGRDCYADQVNWRSSLNTAKVEANRSGKLVLIHFYTPSCGPCKKLERDVFSQPQIATAIEQNYVPVKLNANEAPAHANRFQITEVPKEVVLNPQGNILQKVSCPLEPKAYGAQLNNIANHYRNRSATRLASAQAPINSAYAGLKIKRASTPPQASVATVAPIVQMPATPAITRNPYVTAAQPIVPQRPGEATVVTPAPQPSQPPIGQAIAIPRAARAASKPSLTAPDGSSVAQATGPTLPPTSPEKNRGSDQTLAANQQQATVTSDPVAEPKNLDNVWPPQLPANAPALAFEGYCPVSLREARKWVRGDRALGAIHRDRTYLFASEVDRQKFLAAPDSFSPVFSGYDPVKILEDNQQIAGSREFGFEYRGAFYLFSSKETMTRFAAQPDRYSMGVRQAMNRMDTAAGDAIRR